MIVLLPNFMKRPFDAAAMNKNSMIGVVCPKEMQYITVTAYGNKTFIVPFDPSDSVQVLKEKIYTHTPMGMPRTPNSWGVRMVQRTDER